MRKHLGLKPQDILLLLKLVSLGNQPSRQVDLAKDLGISQAEVVHSLSRLKVSLLIDSQRRPIKLAVLEFLIHAVKYFFPVQLRGVAKGMPTGVSGEHKYVWPVEGATSQGIVVTPLYPTIPMAAQKDPLLHELLALLDAIRMGGVGETEFATRELKKRVIKTG